MTVTSDNLNVGRPWLWMNKQLSIDVSGLVWMNKQLSIDVSGLVCFYIVV